LTAAPHQYGEPLRKTLKGYWKLRVGDYRVVFRVSGQEVWILGIINRKEVYEKNPEENISRPVPRLRSAGLQGKGQRDGFL
jgi:hypothetical protein